MKTVNHWAGHQKTSFIHIMQTCIIFQQRKRWCQKVWICTLCRDNEVIQMHRLQKYHRCSCGLCDLFLWWMASHSAGSVKVEGGNLRFILDRGSLRSDVGIFLSILSWIWLLVLLMMTCFDCLGGNIGVYYYLTQLNGKEENTF